MYLYKIKRSAAVSEGPFVLTPKEGDLLSLLKLSVCSLHFCELRAWRMYIAVMNVPRDIMTVTVDASKVRLCTYSFPIRFGLGSHYSHGPAICVFLECLVDIR